METPDGFPAFDESWRPACDEHGHQFAPEEFVRRIIPAGWEDTAGGVHFDVRTFHRWLGMEMTPASIRETTEMFWSMLRERIEADPDDRPAAIIVRP